MLYYGNVLGSVPQDGSFSVRSSAMNKRYVAWACVGSLVLGMVIGKYLGKWESDLSGLSQPKAASAATPDKTELSKVDVEKAVHDGKNWSVAVVPIDKQWGKEIDIYHGPGQIAGWRYVPLHPETKPKSPAPKTELPKSESKDQPQVENKLEKLEKELKAEQPKADIKSEEKKVEPSK